MGTFGIMSLLAGLSNVVGGLFTLTLSRRQMQQLVALGAGFLLGSAMLTMLPEALHHSQLGPVLVAAGFLGLFAIRRMMAHSVARPDGPSVAAAGAALVGLSLHSFFDGAALGATAYGGGQLAFTAFLAVCLHKLPEGFSLAALFLAATGSRSRAMAATIVMGLATVAGAIIAYTWAASARIPQAEMLAVAAGSFLYVGATDLLPTLAPGRRTIWLVLVGAAMVYLLTAPLGHSH